MSIEEREAVEALRMVVVDGGGAVAAVGGGSVVGGGGGSDRGSLGGGFERRRGHWVEQRDLKKCKCCGFRVLKIWIWKGKGL